MNKRELFFTRIKEKLVGSCSDCSGTGWKEDAIMCKCLKKFEEYLNLDEAGINREYWDLAFEDFKGDAVAKKKATEYVENLESAYENGLGIVFHGTNGTGKTMLSSLILKEALSKGKTIQFITMAEAIMKIQGKISSAEDLKFYETRIKTIEFLCLDNLGSEYQPKNFGSYAVAEFDILARYRRRNFLPTLLTTNLGQDEFFKMYGSSISSLFSACSQFVHVAGKDYRTVQGKEYTRKLKGEVDAGS